jgi:Flp pilus assembly protein TadD/TolB-like protein
MRRIPALILLLCLLPGGLLAENWLVAPFVNLTGKPNLDWIGESVAESVAEALATNGVLVVDRDLRQEAESRLALRSNTQWTLASFLKLAEALDADHLVYGHYEWKAGPGMGTLRLVGEVVNVRHLRRQPGAEAGGPLENLALLQTRLAWHVLRLALPQTAMTEAQFRNSRPRTRLDALESYVRGLLATSPEAREKLFQQALRLEPQYSQAAFRYGRLLAENGSEAGAAPVLEKVKPGDPHYLEARFLLGLIRYQLGEVTSATTIFEALSREVPLSEVWNNLGLAEWRAGQPAALESLRRAQEGDPADPDYAFNLGLALLSSAQYDQAAERFRDVLARVRDDADATKLLGRCLRRTPSPAAELAGVERLKSDLELAAWRQLKALLTPQKN